ncbi:hypothetical protein ABZP36_033431 [Zizania latifolia]
MKTPGLSRQFLFQVQPSIIHQHAKNYLFSPLQSYSMLSSEHQRLKLIEIVTYNICPVHIRSFDPNIQWIMDGCFDFAFRFLSHLYPFPSSNGHNASMDEC